MGMRPSFLIIPTAEFNAENTIDSPAIFFNWQHYKGNTCLPQR